MPTIDVSIVGDTIIAYAKLFSTESQHAKSAMEALCTTRIKPIVSSELLTILESSEPPSLAVNQRLAALPPEKHIAWIEDADEKKGSMYCNEHFGRVCADCNWPQYVIRNNVNLQSRSCTIAVEAGKIQLALQTFRYSAICCSLCLAKRIDDATKQTQ